MVNARSLCAKCLSVVANAAICMDACIVLDNAVFGCPAELAGLRSIILLRLSRHDAGGGFLSEWELSTFWAQAGTVHLASHTRVAVCVMRQPQAVVGSSRLCRVDRPHLILEPHQPLRYSWLLRAGRLLLASGSRDGRVCLWSPDKGSMQQAVHMASPPPQPAQPRSRGKSSQQQQPHVRFPVAHMQSPGHVLLLDGSSKVMCSFIWLAHYQSSDIPERGPLHESTIAT